MRPTTEVERARLDAVVRFTTGIAVVTVVVIGIKPREIRNSFTETMVTLMLDKTTAVVHQVFRATAYSLELDHHLHGRLTIRNYTCS